MDDYEGDNGSAQQMYATMLDSIYGSGGWSVFTIGSGARALPQTLTDQVAMFKYFKTVVWYHFTRAPRLDEANLALRSYLETGGNVFASSIYVDPEYQFVSIDSTRKFTTFDFLFGGFEVELMNTQVSNPDSSTGIILKTGTSTTIAYPLFYYFPASPLEPGETSRDLFRLKDPRAGGAESWTGYPPVAQLFRPTPTAGQAVFFSLPLHLFSGNDNLISTMDYILNQVFE